MVALDPIAGQLGRAHQVPGQVGQCLTLFYLPFQVPDPKIKEMLAEREFPGVGTAVQMGLESLRTSDGNARLALFVEHISHRGGEREMPDIRSGHTSSAQAFWCSSMRSSSIVRSRASAMALMVAGMPSIWPLSIIETVAGHFPIRRASWP